MALLTGNPSTSKLGKDTSFPDYRQRAGVLQGKPRKVPPLPSLRLWQEARLVHAAGLHGGGLCGRAGTVQGVGVVIRPTLLW